MSLADAQCVSLDTSATTVSLDGKFFRRRDHKFFFKAIRLDVSPGDFSQKLALRRRLDELARAHTTGLVIPARDAESVLGIAAQAGLEALVEITITPGELLSRGGYRAILQRCAEIVMALRGNVNLVGYLLDCAIAVDELREHGLARFKQPLSRVLRAMRRADPKRSVAMVNRPATLALASREESLIYARIPALAPAELREYVIRLHNLAECRPIMVEFGEGLSGQDELVACAFGLGAAGVVAPATAPATSRAPSGMRMLRAGELLPFVTLNGSCPPKLATPPLVSVVICAYNAERTMRPCLESLRRLNYPNYEVVIVDDGSRDATAEIAADFPEFRLIRQSNKGLSVARNVGMQAAAGEIVAYTDSDCVVDSDWLNLMTRAMVEGNFDGCGGPNYAPHESGRREACVAASPGAPCHVLIGDDRAEHLAGCNMVFRKSALEQLGGFDPQFTAAGDDVDICWRMIDAGFTLGFCPAAFVWHFRRNTIKAYYGQQRGYGNAEAMLYLKYPERFNALGQIRWRGVIPGVGRTIPGGGRTRVSWSGRGNTIQLLSARPLNILSVLPLTAEWQCGAAVLLALSAMAGFSIIPALVLLSLGPIWAAYYAAKAPLEAEHEGLGSRLLIGWLAYSGPISRTLARYRMRRRARKPLDQAPRQRPKIDLRRRALGLAYWNERWTTRDHLLSAITDLLGRAGSAATPDYGWGDADLKLEPGALSRVDIKTADEEHSGNRVKNLVALRARLAGPARAGLTLGLIAAVTALAAGSSALAIAASALTAALGLAVIGEAASSLRLCYRVVEQAAAQTGLTPLGAPSALMRRKPASQVAATARQLDRIAG